jgi:hypothetical protein
MLVVVYGVMVGRLRTSGFVMLQFLPIALARLLGIGHYWHLVSCRENV